MLLKNNSSFAALGGVGSALSMIFLIVASFLPSCRLAFVFCSSVVVGILICAYGNKLALVHYICVSLLAVLFLPNKTIAVLYCVVTGNYPLVKRYLERIGNIRIRYVVKLVVFNLYMIICMILGLYLLNIEFSTDLSLWLIWIASLFAFVIYDYIYMPFVYKAYDLINKI